MSRLVLGQSRSVGKKNEIETVMALLELLELQGATVTLDAMSCQRKIAKRITGKGADYVISLKGNQGNLHKEVKAYFHKTHRDAPELIDRGQIETTDAGHGRIEVRRYRQLAITDWLSEARDWDGAQSVVEVDRERPIGQTMTTDFALDRTLTRPLPLFREPRRSSTITRTSFAGAISGISPGIAPVLMWTE